MARPKKQTVDYFPHYCNHGKTMYILEQKYGNDGYAFWFKLLELLGSAEGHYLKFEGPADWEYLAAKTKLSGDACEEILNLLATLEAIDIEAWKYHIVWSDKFIENIKDAYRNRVVDIPGKPDCLRNKIASNGVSDVRNPQMKVNEKKLDNTLSEKSFSDDSLEMKMVKYMIKRILENYSAAKIPDTPTKLQKWCLTFDRLMRIDQRSVDDIRAVMTWVYQDDFWYSQIRSPNKLREKWDTLYMQMQGRKKDTDKPELLQDRQLD